MTSVPAGTTTMEPEPAAVTGAGPSSFLEPIREYLGAVEEILKHQIRSDVRAAYAISGHTLSAGGKRLRPALVMLSAHASLVQYPARTIQSCAAAAELIHMASLIHDDVVDNAEERRGRPTANAAFGNQISVLVGDYLLAKSIYLAATEGTMDVIRVFSDVTVGLSEGEVLQITAKGDADTSEETYRRIIEKKTAGFISGCCRIGGMLAGASEQTLESLSLFGLNCGLAFQIADDLLDYVGNPEITGKALDGDLREGKMTLPLILALRDTGEAERREYLSVLEDPEALSGADIQKVHDLIKRYDGFRRTSTVAAGYVAEAQKALVGVPASIYRDSLSALAEYSLVREV